MTNPRSATRLAHGVAALALLACTSALPAEAQTTKTPIKHVIVLFQENISFDHYFATYPMAMNLPASAAFHAAPGTPTVNGLTEALLTHNPNKANPVRLLAAAGGDLRHGSRLHAGAAGLRRRADGQVHRIHVALCRREGLRRQCGDGLFRRQYGDGAVELRPAFRPQRQFLRHEFRPLEPWRHQSRLRQYPRRRAGGYEAG